MRALHEHRPRVAVIGTNDPRNVSGGRYHALMLAYAVAATGGEAHVITDHVPGFVADLEPLCPGGVTMHQTADFVAGLPEGAFDWVVVVPTGIFLPDFYEACLDFAARAAARLALINFESANWFNAEAPEPRDPRIWDYWRRVCAGGGLILSSTRTAQDWAKTFYAAPEGELRFEVWSPPVNSLAARRFDGLRKDGSILVFIRPQDAHKGSSLLSRIDPEVFANRTLRLISGRDVPEDFAAAMRAHLAKVPGAKLEILLRVSDVQKFRLMTMAQAVLCTTKFEGFGYPPVEAAYAGTEAVCYDLPVLRETVGKIAHFAPTQDVAGLEAALHAALRQPERRETLRRHVHGFADFEQAAWHLADILLRSTDRVAPLQPRPFRVAIGPFARAPLRPAAQLDRHAALPGFAPYVVSAVAASGGDILITARASLAAGAIRLQADIAGQALPLAVDAMPQDANGFRDTRFYIIAPRDSVQRRLTVTAVDEAGPRTDVIELRLDHVAPASRSHPAVAGISESKAVDGQTWLRGWVLAREAVSSVFLRADGTTWQRIAVTADRRDVQQQHPSYAAARCEFSGHVTTTPPHDMASALWLCVAGPAGKERAVDLLTGWPPVMRPYFTQPLAAPAAAPQPAKPAEVAPLAAIPRRPCLGRLQLARHSDEKWSRGVARTGGPDRLGSILVHNDAACEAVAPGGILRFDNATARRVVAVQTGGATAEIVLDGPLLSAGNAFAEIMDPVWTPPEAARFVLEGFSDARWWNAVWNEAGARFRRGFALPAGMAAQLGIAAGARLNFAASGARRVVAVEDDGAGRQQVWLDDAIRPIGDGAPHAVIVAQELKHSPGQLAFSLARADAGWPGGVLAQNTGRGWAGQAILLDTGMAAAVRRGTLLRFAGELVLRATGVTAMDDGLEVTLDGVLDPARHGHPMALWLADASDQPDGGAPYVVPNPGLRNKDPLFLQLSSHAKRHGGALRPVAPSPPQRRVLFISLVSPCPANQGNRVVTRNLIRHLVERGYGCDVIVQNWVDGAAVAREFGPQVRLLSVPVPKWQEAPAARMRHGIAAAAAPSRAAPLEAELAVLFDQAAENFHPFFIVRDETVELARTLYAGQEYDALICNYTHMARVAVELQAIRPLPPTAVITHDALSRLPRAFGGKKLDLAYRACPPGLERDVLNAVPDAVVVAISSSEASYFAEIGVRNPIILTEYDAAEEMAASRVPESAFERRRIIFNGSANPMNLAGLDWFVDECWATILAQVPDARLIVCGRAGEAWQANVPGVELAGELPREKMVALCAGASMTINPCVAGTGLKIKTVEAACLGLPAVCLPAAVDGLEEDAAAFAIVTRDGAAFAAGCVALLTDAALWARLRAGAIDLAERRFCADAVYAALDAALGLTQEPADEGPPRMPAPAPLAVAEPLRRLAENPHDEAALMTLGRELIGAGQAAAGWEMVERVGAARRGDTGIALQAATAALEAGEFWRAVSFSADIIAQRPALGEGYRLMGRGLLGCRLPHDAVAALEQGALTAPWHAGVLAALEDALIAAGRNAEVPAWRAARPHPPAYQSYVPFDGAHTVPASGAELWIALPQAPAAQCVIAMDFRTGDVAQDVEMEILTAAGVARTTIRGPGPRIETVQIPVNLNVFETNGVLQLRIRLTRPTAFGTPLKIIGYLLENHEGERQFAAPVV